MSAGPKISERRNNCSKAKAAHQYPTTARTPRRLSDQCTRQLSSVTLRARTSFPQRKFGSRL
jgi:hypothetical protein